MTQEEKRIRIASRCGWKTPEVDGSFLSYVPMPCYFSDLNCCADMEKEIKGTHMWGEYKRRLSIICMTGWEFPIDANAEQRAEAFGLTLGLWKEGE